MNHVPIGNLDQVAADRILGWAGFQGQPDPVVVEIYIGEQKIWECLAAQPRPDIGASGDNPRCGFLVESDFSSLENGAKVFAKIRGVRGFLHGSGKLLPPTCGPLPSRPVSGDPADQAWHNAIGHLGKVANGRIAGWAGILNQQDPVTVEIYLDGRKLTECMTGRERPGVSRGGNHVRSHSGFYAEYNSGDVTYRSRLFANVLGSPKLLAGSGKFVEPGRSPKLFFMHIPKTGGVTINWIAEFLYERRQDHLELFNWEDGSFLRGFEFLSAHALSGQILPFKKQGFRLFTMLREPYLRFRSALNYYVWNTIMVSRRYSAVDPTTLQIFQALQTAGSDLAAQILCLQSLSYDSRFRKEINNHFDNCMTRYLASVEDGSTLGPADVRRAQDVLSQFDAIGILSLLPETLERLSLLTGKPWHEYSAVWMNKGLAQKILNRDDQDLNLAKPFIWADQEVYETALEMFHAKS
jgi:hypothetical protein